MAEWSRCSLHDPEAASSNPTLRIFVMHQSMLDSWHHCTRSYSDGHIYTQTQTHTDTHRHKDTFSQIIIIVALQPDWKYMKIQPPLNNQQRQQQKDMGWCQTRPVLFEPQSRVGTGQDWVEWLNWGICPTNASMEKLMLNQRWQRQWIVNMMTAVHCHFACIMSNSYDTKLKTFVPISLNKIHYF